MGSALFLWACSGSSGSPDELMEDQVDEEVEVLPERPPLDDTPELPDPAELACSPVARMGLIGIQPRLGTGIELFVRLEGRDGETLAPGAYLDCLRLIRPNGSTLERARVSATRPADGALTAVLVAPGRSADEAARARELVESFMAARPAGEQIAIFRWGAEVHQVAGFATSRAAARRLAARGLVHANESLLPPGEAVAAVQRDLEALSPGAFHGVRSIVVIAPEQPVEALPEVPPHLVVLWGLRPDTALAGAKVVPLDVAESAAALSDVLDGHVEAGLAYLAWCGSGQPDRVRVRAPGSAAEISLQAPAPLREEAHMQCSTEALAGPRAYPERIELVFATEEQRQTYRQRIDEGSKDKFDLMLRLWDGGALVPAKAKLRGSSSMHCERKNYAVDIKGPEARRFMPGSASDEFFLLSMCMDDHYINQHTANALAARLGFFPLKNRFIELVVDGEHRGIYLFMENPKDELLIDNSRVRALVRRSTDSRGYRPKIEYAHESKQQARDDYESLVDRIRRATGSELMSVLRRGMDIDQYLRWIALMTLLRNGDYIDEVFFISTQTIDGSRRPTDFYTIANWDMDDLYKGCHYNGDYAIRDPHGMLYCTEAVIDHAMFADAGVYARYVRVLESVLAEISVEVFDAALDETVRLLGTYFHDEDIRKAMIEMHRKKPKQAPSYEEVMDAIHGAAAKMKRNFADSHRQLRRAIATWRDSNP